MNSAMLSCRICEATHPLAPLSSCEACSGPLDVRYVWDGSHGLLDNPRSLWSRDAEAQVLPTVRELGIGYVAYSPLGRGFLTGEIRRPEDFPDNDYRRFHPRFTGENFAKNIALVDRIEAMATEKGVTAAQLALAWVLAKGDDIVPIPGTKRRSYLDQNIAATRIELNRDELDALDAILPPGAAGGDRYQPQGMATVNG